MLTFRQLVSLHRSLDGRKVLSVYVDGGITNPAERRTWKTQLDIALKDLREWLRGSPHGEREAFEKCVTTLDTLLAPVTGTIRSPGWVAFIADGKVIDAHELPVPVPTLGVWSTGPAIAPYMRALKAMQPVIVVLADASKSDIYVYSAGRSELVDTVRSHHVIEPKSHMGAPPAPGFHVGTRGPSGRDAAQQKLLAGRDRMIGEAVERACAIAGTHCFIVVGGIARVARKIVDELAESVGDRVMMSSDLDIHSSNANIGQAARSAARERRNAIDSRRLIEIAESAGAGGLGVLGPIETALALEKAAVRDLYLSHEYVENNPADAERAIRVALDQAASVEEVSGEGAERLERVGGMAAGLRFTG